MNQKIRIIETMSKLRRQNLITKKRVCTLSVLPCKCCITHVDWNESHTVVQMLSMKDKTGFSQQATNPDMAKKCSSKATICCWQKSFSNVSIFLCSVVIIPYNDHAMNGLCLSVCFCCSSFFVETEHHC